MNIKLGSLFVALVLFTMPLIAAGQTALKTARIGLLYFGDSSASASPSSSALLQGWLNQA